MIHSSAILIIASAFFLFSAFPCIAQSTCFYPNGDVASDRIPCNNGGRASVCCAKNFLCLSNGLCVDNRYENFQRVLRGSCTSKSGGGSCPKYCSSQWPQGDEAVYYCGNGKYCCTNRECCSKGEGLMDLGQPQVTATAGVGVDKAAIETPKPATQPQAQPQAPKQPQQAPQPQQSQKAPPAQQPQPTQEVSQAQPPARTTEVPQPPRQQEQQQQQSVTSLFRPPDDPEGNTSISPSLQPSSVSQVPWSEESSSTISTSVNTALATTSMTQATFTNNQPTPATVTVSPTLAFYPPSTVSGPSNSPSAPGKEINWPIVGVGIGVGIALLIFLIILTAYILVRRYKKNAVKKSDVKRSSSPSGSPDSTQSRDVEALFELEGDLKLIEMAAEREKREIDGKTVKQMTERDRIIAGLMRRETSMRSEKSNHSNSDVETLDLDRQSNHSDLYSRSAVIRRESPWMRPMIRNSV